MRASVKVGAALFVLGLVYFVSLPQDLTDYDRIDEGFRLSKDEVYGIARGEVDDGVIYACDLRTIHHWPAGNLSGDLWGVELYTTPLFFNPKPFDVFIIDDATGEILYHEVMVLDIGH